MNLRKQFIEPIDSLSEQHVKHVAGGGCKSFEEYKMYIGILQGLKLAHDSIEDSLKTLDLDEDSDETEG